MLIWFSLISHATKMYVKVILNIFFLKLIFDFQQCHYLVITIFQKIWMMEKKHFARSFYQA